MLPAYFDAVHARIAGRLQEFLQQKADDLTVVNGRGPDAARRLQEFCLRGKMLRGCLVHLGWCLAGGSSAGSEAVTNAGAAMELLQSGLLVHDDIMDRDEVRRGQPALYRHYAEAAAAEGVPESPRVGEALGICVGDVAYFMAFELLARAEMPGDARAGVIELCARELSAVGIAQMQDVYWGASRSPVDARQIALMYRYKTGRYSFSLPLLTGARLAGADEALQGMLEAGGEVLGLLFQVRDDELGLFGDVQDIGKPAGSDLREGKKTILFSVIAETAPAEDRARLHAILGNPGLAQEDLAFVRALASRAEVRRRMKEITDPLVREAERRVGEITSGTEADRAALRWLLDFSMDRGQ